MGDRQLAWTTEPRFSTLAARKEHEDELNSLVEAWTIDKDAADVMTRLQNAGVEAGVVRTMEEALEHCPQADYRHYWWTLNQPEIGKMVFQGNSYLLSKTPYQIQQPAPLFGEHTEYVCTQIPGNTR